MKPTIASSVAAAKFLNAFYDEAEKKQSVYCSLSYNVHYSQVSCHSMDTFEKLILIVIIVGCVAYVLSKVLKFMGK
jgi:hypothetical protein|uniref:Uncharacterized protein n=1 Tax=viral metagenome TaxID=1070528 RepID=A0A6C0CTG9_9ZZZZ